MSGAWQAFAVALTASLALTPVVRRLALALGALDRPNERSVHSHPVPLLGGLAVFAAFAAATLVTTRGGDAPVHGVLLGGLVIVLVGLVDDLVTLRPSAKLAGQVLAALVLPAFGVRIDHVTNPFGEGLLWMGLLAVPVTTLWVVAVVNIMNLVDGLDGLATGIGSIAALTLLVAALLQPEPLVLPVLLAAALAGAGIGFLPYNFHPAKIFLGDAGAMFVGYALAATSILGSLKSPAAVTLAVPVLALGLPILDTGLAIYRRWRRGTSIARADREHFHHRLLQLGLSQREAVLAMYLGTGWLGISALAVQKANLWIGLGIVLFVALSLGLAAWKVGMLHAGRRTPPLRPHPPLTRSD